MPLFSAILILAIATDREVGDAFLTAVNSKDREAIKRYISERCVAEISPDTFADRLMPFANQGAPFMLERVVDDKPRLFRALISDKDSTKFALTLTLNGETPTKVTGVLLGDPATLGNTPPKDYSNWTNQQTLAERIRKETDSPALALAFSVGSQPIRVAVTGVRTVGKEDKVGENEVWHLGSISKSITATLIGRLIELGKLDWESKLGDLIKGVTMTREQREITLFQIMRHRAGLPADTAFTREQVDKILGEETDPVKIRDLYAKDILKRPLSAKPDEKFQYSNAGYALLGHIAETVMGQPFEILCKEYLFEPMKLTTAVAGTAELPQQRPSGHWYEDGKLTQIALDENLRKMMTPAGDMSMSISDLVRYGKAHLDGMLGKDGVLKAETIKRLHEAVEEGEGKPGYACGWSVGPLPGTQMRHGHNGSDMTFIAELAIFPESKLVAASVVNRGGDLGQSPAFLAVLAVGRKFAAPR